MYKRQVVDGVIRFDINEDPTDMRIDIDPEAAIPAFMETLDHSEDDSCMQGVQGHFSHSHKH